jgi:hypothetical protein
LYSSNFPTLSAGADGDIILTAKESMQGTELRAKRAAAEISGDLLCAADRETPRNRLTAIEKGYVRPRPGEIERLAATLDRLIAAKARIDQVAAEVGWPTAGAAA